MLTLTHYIDPVLGAYWYSLEGPLVDSEGSAFMVGEGGSSLERMLNDIEYYRSSGFIGGAVLTHKVIQEG